MEPGHEDREYWLWGATPPGKKNPPQWSPVMKTGNTPPHASKQHPATCLNGARS